MSGGTIRLNKTQKPAGMPAFVFYLQHENFSKIRTHNTNQL